ncbi:hypothetical protein C8J56DRAFT_905871 [Mycena floridula]|nr:hypothetical protein C8J56DRAFT_905871 [Mycena floridula]
MPLPELVALRYMWDKQNEVREFVQWLCVTDVSGFSQANDYIRDRPLDAPDVRFLRFVNACTKELRHKIQEFDVRAWFGAMLWQMMPLDLSEEERARNFFKSGGGGSLRHFSFLSPPTSSCASSIFKTAINDSGHTCWDKDDIDDYAAARELLGEDVKVVGIQKVSVTVECKMCMIENPPRPLPALLGIGETELRAVPSLSRASKVKVGGDFGARYHWASSIGAIMVELDFVSTIEGARPLAVIQHYLAQKPIITLKCLAALPKDTINLAQVYGVIQMDAILSPDNMCPHVDCHQGPAGVSVADTTGCSSLAQHSITS